jgi:hypothetical protein
MCTCHLRTSIDERGSSKGERMLRHVGKSSEIQRFCRIAIGIEERVDFTVRRGHFGAVL